MNRRRNEGNSPSKHWDSVYRQKKATDVSWYRPHLDVSLELIDTTNLPPASRLIDVGGGASTLVDDLLDEGFQDITVLDLASSALDVAKQRLGERANRVAWIAGDVTRVALPEATFDLWHDRAVFHFLTEESDQMRYVEQVRRAVKPGGYVIVATFGPHGPDKCSGLPVARYDEAGLHGTFGAEFTLLESRREEHDTPWGIGQEFVYCCCLKN